jgi:autotransporter adhesin
LSSGIAGAIASTHAIRNTEGLRLGIGAYNGQKAIALGGRIKDKTFTFTIDSQSKVSLGFGLDL